MGNEVFGAALLSFLSGGAIVAMIGFLGDRFKFREERRAKKEDRAEAKADKTEELEKAVAKINERMEAIETQNAAQSEALRLIMLDRILHLGSRYIQDGAITLDDRRRLHAMHDCYHNGLNGNGDAKVVMDAVDELPLKV